MNELIFSAFRSKWISNPHFRGCYSYQSIEAEENNTKFDDLATPVSSKNKNNVLLFAGEATNATHFSTVHGAIESGYRDVQRLIDLYK